VTAGPLADNVVVLERVHRFGEDIARLALAIRDGRSDDAVAALRSQSAAISWIEPDQAPDGLAVVRDRAVAAGEQTVLAARRGDARTALASLSGFRVLCAHRRGMYGVGEWTVLLERWLSERISGFRARAPWYVGRPVMVTANDYALGLFNGDTGVVVAGEDGRPEVAFARGVAVVRVSPARLVDTDTVQAMTIHKSQGSQFDTVVVVVPDQSSPLLTRELLYTGVTRARAQVIVVGSEGAIRAAVDRPIARASGLRERLWGPGQPDRLTGSGAG
jgi:exodeoxyribonuclease V alpha subunit